MRAALPQFILMEAIIAKMNCEISTLMGYYHAIKYIGPERLSSHQWLDGNVPMC